MKLEKNLQHQIDALDAICSVFEGVNLKRDDSQISNPIIDWKGDAGTRERLCANIADKQRSNAIPVGMRANSGIKAEDAYLNIDVKMETGTGKTFTQVQTMYELNARYGFTKFIIVVPTLTIKAGTQSFISSPDTRNFFSEGYHDTELVLNVVESAPKKKGRSYFPNTVREWAVAPSVNTKKIQVMLLNSQLITTSKGLLTKEYDSTIMDRYAVPFDAIKAVKPVIIIDEPHRFSKANVTFQSIVSDLGPQCVIRFGATFPEQVVVKETVRGGRLVRVKEKTKDYHNLVYNLDSVDSFNMHLIKGVIGESVPASAHGNDRVVELMSVDNRTTCRFRTIRANGNTTVDLHRGDRMALVDPDFGELEVSEIKTSSVIFSNGTEIEVHSKLSPESFSETYHEKMIEVALSRHFETEKKNFRKNIKTLALFFIDDISSVRDAGDKKPYILNSFDEILKRKLEKEIVDTDDEAYREYLEESLGNISDCSAAYFAVDKKSVDANIKSEVDDILFNKERLLKIRGEDGKYNIRRFIFSKWTLKEGWDNPNIFTIAKLRSSGSETSKIQEVGRGLRLPVDTYLNRLSWERDAEGFYLNYVVDFTEESFVKELVSEINGEHEVDVTVTPEILDEIGVERHMSGTRVWVEMVNLGMLDMDKKLTDMDAFRQYCPKIYEKYFAAKKLGTGIVVTHKKDAQINVRKGNFEKIEEMWKKINQRYLINFESIPDEETESAVTDILNGFTGSTQAVETERRGIQIVDGVAVSVDDGGIAIAVQKAMKYSDFIINLSEATHVPAANLHNAVVRYAEGRALSDNFFNGTLLTRLASKINQWKAEKLFKRFQYKRVDMTFKDTTFRDGDKIRETIVLGNVGNYVSENVTPQEKYLYDAVAYDSEIEKKDIFEEIEEVIVFGKIPKHTVNIPIVNGESYSPDFMYLVKKADGSQELNLVIESKGYDSETGLSIAEDYRIKCAEKFFEEINSEGFNVKYRLQTNGRLIREIIGDLAN